MIPCSHIALSSGSTAAAPAASDACPLIPLQNCVSLLAVLSKIFWHAAISPSGAISGFFCVLSYEKLASSKTVLTTLLPAMSAFSCGTR